MGGAKVIGGTSLHQRRGYLGIAVLAAVFTHTAFKWQMPNQHHTQMLDKFVWGVVFSSPNHPCKSFIAV